MTAAIEIAGLHQFVRVGFLNRRVDVLFGVDLTVPAGSVFGLVGHNGAGKSTTIKTLIGALTPSEGTVRLFGEDPKKAATRRRLGYLPEVLQLPRTLTPREVLAMHGGLCGFDRDHIRKRSAALLDRVGLTARADSLVRTFSKGMAQRLALAVALYGAPDLLILDEPMSGLDPMGRALVRQIILEERAQGRAVFLSSHVLPDVQALCDRVAVMHKGRVVMTGTLDELFAGREHVYEIEVRKDDALDVESLGAYGHVDERPDLAVVTVRAGLDPMAAAIAIRERGGHVTEVRRGAAELEQLLVDLVDELEGPS